jgi:hypothetical protein
LDGLNFEWRICHYEGIGARVGNATWHGLCSYGRHRGDMAWEFGPKQSGAHFSKTGMYAISFDQKQWWKSLSEQ